MHWVCMTFVDCLLVVKENMMLSLEEALVYRKKQIDSIWGLLL